MGPCKGSAITCLLIEDLEIHDISAADVISAHLGENCHFFQPGPNFSIHFCLTEWWYFRFLGLLPSGVRDRQSFGILAPGDRYYMGFRCNPMGARSTKYRYDHGKFFLHSAHTKK